MPLQVEILTKAEVEEIWRDKARAQNFAEYVDYLNRVEIGRGIAITPDKGEKNAESARMYRANFAEAAKERIKGTVDAKGVFVPALDADGKPIPEPVEIRWKTESHDVVRKAKDGTETTSKVIDKIRGQLVASVAESNGVASTDRPQTEIVVPLNPPANVREITLPDGRIAKKGKGGTWRAPKLPPPVIPLATDVPDSVAQNGLTGDIPKETVHAERPAVESESKELVTV